MCRFFFYPNLWLKVFIAFLWYYCCIVVIRIEYYMYTKDKELLRKRIEKIGYSEKVVNPKVSVIVPAYNVESFIEKCLTTLVLQTLKDIEIIVINDGATDSTPEIISEFAAIDSRIKVINKQNGGLSSARNAGLEVARGEYIGFVDSDDWVDEDFYEKLYTTAKNRQCDIACATIVRKRERTQKYRINYIEEKIFRVIIHLNCDYQELN